MRRDDQPAVLLEAARVAQVLDVLPGRAPAAGVAPRRGLRPTGIGCRGHPGHELGQLRAHLPGRACLGGGRLHVVVRSRRFGHDGQEVSGLHGRARCHRHRVDPARRGGQHHVLHLHGLEDGDGAPGRVRCRRGSTSTRRTVPAKGATSVIGSGPSEFSVGTARFLTEPDSRANAGSRRGAVPCPDRYSSVATSICVAHGLVDVAPVFEGTLEHFVAAELGQIVRHRVDETSAGGVVHDLGEEGPGLTEIVVLGVQRVGGAHHLTVGGPHGILGVGLGVRRRGAVEGVRVVHRVGHVVDAHGPVLGVAAHRGLRPVHGDLLVVDAEAGAVGIGVGEAAGEQHLVGGEAGTGHRVVRLERRLLHLGVIVGHVAIEREGAHVDQRVVGVRPDLGQVEGVEAVGLCVVERHDLHFEGPAGELAALDRVVEVALVVVGVLAGDAIRLGLRQVLDPLLGLEVVLDPEALVLRVDPQVGVRRVPVHVAPRARDAPVTHEVGDLVGRLGREGPEVPLHVGIAQVVGGQAFLRTDEVLELDRVTDEEDRRVVADDVEVSVGRVEPDGEAPRVAPGVGRAALAGHGREADHQVGLGPGREDGRLGVRADVAGDLEDAEGSAALGMGLALGDALAVEVRHLLNQVEVLEQDGAVGADGEGMLLAGDRDPGVGGGRRTIRLRRGHGGVLPCVRHSASCVHASEAISAAPAPGRPLSGDARGAMGADQGQRSTGAPARVSAGPSARCGRRLSARPPCRRR